MHYFHTKTSKKFLGRGHSPIPIPHPQWGWGHPLLRPLSSDPNPIDAFGVSIRFHWTMDVMTSITSMAQWSTRRETK